MKSSSDQVAATATAVTSQSTLHAHWQRFGYRWLAGLSVLCALALAMLTPHDQGRLQMPDPWAYELAAANFAQGKWVLSDNEAAAGRTQIRLQGSRLTQYVPVGENAWGFRQSPGHPLQLVLFQAVGRPRLAGAALAILAALALYPLLARWYSERLAFLGVTLFMWTPITLTAVHYYNMDTLAGGVWPLIAGALLLCYGGQEGHGRWLPLLLFAAGFALGWSVVVRVTNLLLLGLFTLYFLYLVWLKRPPLAARPRRRRPKKGRPGAFGRLNWPHIAAFGLGCLLALAILAIYNRLSFGAVLASGYLYQSPDDRMFIWKENPVTSVPGGVSTWLAGRSVGHLVLTLVQHIWLWLRPATFAWPLWPLALAGLAIRLRQERPIHQTTWFLALWLLAVYAPYAGVVFFGVTRALAVPANQTWHFFVVARYLFPITLPLVLLITGVLNRQPRRLAFGLTGLYLAVGAAVFWYAQTR